MCYEFLQKLKWNILLTVLVPVFVSLARAHFMILFSAM